jgi:hypothetical protein
MTDLTLFVWLVEAVPLRVAFGTSGNKLSICYDSM